MAGLLGFFHLAILRQKTDQNRSSYFKYSEAGTVSDHLHESDSENPDMTVAIGLYYFEERDEHAKYKW